MKIESRPWCRSLLVVAGLLIAGSSSIHAAPIAFTNQPLNSGWFVGSGQTNTNFVGVRDSAFSGGSLELGLRAQQRSAGSIVPIAHNFQNMPGNNMYVVQTGHDTTQPDLTRAWWNFDFSVAYAGGLGNLDGLGITIEELTGNLTPLPDVNFLPLPAIPLAQASWNPTFGFLGGASYDLTATGLYRITLTANENGQTASTSILVNVGNVAVPVPEPTSLALFGMTAAAGAFYSWRRRRKANFVLLPG